MATTTLPIAEILARARAAQNEAKARLEALKTTGAAALLAGKDNNQVRLSVLAPEVPGSNLPAAKKQIQANERQLAAIALGRKKQSFVLIGAAGTGKTTTIKLLAEMLMAENILGRYKVGSQNLPVGAPRTAFVAFTNRAKNNLQRQLPPELQPTCLTCHKLIEYTMEPVMVEDTVNGGMKKSMRSYPRRDASNPIYEVEYIFFEESSNIGTRLHQEVIDACPNAVPVYLGDLYQLQPVYDDPILGYKLMEFPVVELTEIWRQAADNPVIRLAHDIKNGKKLSEADLQEYAKDPRISLKPHPLAPSGKLANVDETSSRFYTYVYKKLSKTFDPFTDMMLCPMNVKFGCDEVNRWFAQASSEAKGVPVWEVIAGRQKHYFSIGDKLMVNKEECVVYDIVRNGSYVGVPAKKESLSLNRWGFCSGAMESVLAADEETTDWTIPALTLEATYQEVEDRKHQASHTIKFIKLEDARTLGLSPDLDVRRLQFSEVEPFLDEISTAKEINDCSFAWCISVHKAQGSEFRNVHVLLHNSHANMLTREGVYTAVTRTSQNLIIYYDRDSNPITPDSSIARAVRNPQLGGLTLEAKIKIFAEKVGRKQTVLDMNKLNAQPQQPQPVPSAWSVGSVKETTIPF
jgi:hypothetical protein